MSKSSVTAVTLAACGLAASQYAAADDIHGMYVQADFGVTATRSNTGLKDLGLSNKNNHNDTTILPRLSVGHDFGDVRVAGDYTHYPKVGKDGLSIRTEGVGASVIYDIDTGIPVQPYIGARLAVNKIKSQYHSDSSYLSHSKTVVSPGVMAGVGFKTDRNLTIDAGYRYNHLDNNHRAHEVSVGVRYTFN